MSIIYDYLQAVQTNNIKDGAVTDAKIAASGITTRSKLPTPLVYDDEDNFFTGRNYFDNSNLKLYNPAKTFVYSFVTGAIGANRSIIIPALAGDDTIAFLGIANTFTAKQKISVASATDMLVIDRPGDNTPGLAFGYDSSGGPSIEFGPTSGARDVRLYRLDPNTIGVRNVADNAYKNFYADIVTCDTALYTNLIRSKSGAQAIVIDSATGQISGIVLGDDINANSKKITGIAQLTGRAVGEFSITTGNNTGNLGIYTRNSSGTDILRMLFEDNAAQGFSTISYNENLVPGAAVSVKVFTKAGAISDGDFSNPVDGLLGVDTTNGRIYFRYGGAWHYCAATA